MQFNSALFWHRRDLRMEDNAGLLKALQNSKDVTPVFIFDSTILDKLPLNDARITFIWNEIVAIKKAYNTLGSDLIVLHGDPIIEIPRLAGKHNVSAVYTNRDYEPYALKRDETIYKSLKLNDIAFIGSKDHVVFEKNEVLKPDGLPYTVFTPYSRRWKAFFNENYISSYPSEKYLSTLNKVAVAEKLISLEQLGFKKNNSTFPSRQVDLNKVSNYQEKRNFPSANGTTMMSVHLRFGTISIRSLVNQCIKKSETYLNELIWRDFYQMIIFHFPHSAKDAFRKQYDLIDWEKDMGNYESWCTGKTGYPIVDAGMRELNSTGFMHNRVRMVVASFLTKHLLLDWRLGADYFAEKLLDFELASNTGGWQWAAGCGCDAAPYFRVFNPTTQQQKFDKDLSYIRKWIPEFDTDEYPQPIVEHKFARERALHRYKKGLGKL